MPDRFVSLAATLGPGSALPAPGECAAAASAPAEAPPREVAGEGSGDASIVAALRELSLMRVAAREAYARLAPRLLEALARDVLGRELAAGPCDLERLARVGLARFEAFEPVRVRLPAGTARLDSLGVPVTEDTALASHDFIIEVRDGIIDARFATRLNAALEACA